MAGETAQIDTTQAQRDDEAHPDRRGACLPLFIHMERSTIATACTICILSLSFRPIYHINLLVGPAHTSVHTWMYLPKRLELSLRTVRAFPNASRIGLDSSTCCSIVPSSVDPVLLPRMARYFMMILHVSVLPAPDSPLTRMDCQQQIVNRCAGSFLYEGYLLVVVT